MVVTLSTLSKGKYRQLYECLGSPFQGQHCLPQLGKPLEKVWVNKACSGFNLAGNSRSAGLHHSERKQKNKFTVATWNVRTMLDNDTRPERRSALIDIELSKYNIDIAALQETRMEGEGQLQERHYTFYWIGKTSGRRDAGVAFAVHNNLAKSLPKLPTGFSERLMSLRLHIGKSQHLTLFCIYAPTMSYSDEDKESFYQELKNCLEKVPKEDKLLVLGDFNARIGCDYVTYPEVIGKFSK